MDFHGVNILDGTRVSSHGTAKGRLRRACKRLLLAFLACYLLSAAWQVYKPLPAGIGRNFPAASSGDVALLTDITYVDAAGVRHSDQQVFDEILRLIGEAQRVVVVDMFLFNDFAGADAAPNLRPLSAQLTQALVERKRAVPGLQVVMITDPINTLYGGMPSKHLDALHAEDIETVVTDLSRIRAPNPVWSGLWQLCCRWLGNSDHGGWLPSPFGQGKATLRSYLALLNLKANHRKTLVVDSGDDWVGLVASANPHDGSSAHGNVALRFRGPAALDLLRSERAVVAMSGAAWPQPLISIKPSTLPAGLADGTQVQILTEGRIRDALLASVASAKPGDRLDIAVFYFSHRGLVKEVAAAQQRGVKVRVLLDPNEDAFGRKKNGISEMLPAGRQEPWQLHCAHPQKPTFR